MDFFSKCQITDEGVRIRVLFVTWNIPFSKIKTIRKVPFWKYCLETMSLFHSAMWSTGDISLQGVVIIETRKGIRVALSPKDADEFVRRVASRITASN
jgi:hypothetical protein